MAMMALKDEHADMPQPRVIYKKTSAALQELPDGTAYVIYSPYLHVPISQLRLTKCGHVLHLKRQKQENDKLVETIYRWFLPVVIDASSVTAKYNASTTQLTILLPKCKATNPTAAPTGSTSVTPPEILLSHFHLEPASPSASASTAPYSSISAFSSPSLDQISIDISETDSHVILRVKPSRFHEDVNLVLRGTRQICFICRHIVCEPLPPTAAAETSTASGVMHNSSQPNGATSNGHNPHKLRTTGITKRYTVSQLLTLPFDVAKEDISVDVNNPLLADGCQVRIAKRLSAIETGLSAHEVVVPIEEYETPPQIPTAGPSAVAEAKRAAEDSSPKQSATTEPMRRRPSLPLIPVHRRDFALERRTSLSTIAVPIRAITREMSGVEIAVDHDANHPPQPQTTKEHLKQ